MDAFFNTRKEKAQLDEELNCLREMVPANADKLEELISMMNRSLLSRSTAEEILSRAYDFDRHLTPAESKKRGGRL